MKGQQKHIVDQTFDPFDWFPELNKVFKNFNIKNLEFEPDLELIDKDIARVIFKIKRNKKVK